MAPSCPPIADVPPGPLPGSGPFPADTPQLPCPPPSLASILDPDSDPANPRRYLVDVQLVRRLRRTITLNELKAHPAIAGMPLLRRGNRLSVMPLSATEWDAILGLE